MTILPLHHILNLSETHNISNINRN